MINLIIGLTAGLTRIGWRIDVPAISVHHGAIMVGGFLGALISLEKAIPIGKRWVFIVPALCALTPLIAIELFHDAGLWFLLAGSIGLSCIQCSYLIRFPHEPSMTLMLVGACCLMVGNVMLMHTSFYPSAFPWWMGFVLCTIVGERLELSKFLPVSLIARRLLFGLLLVFIVGLVLPFHQIGKYLSGIALAGIAIWLLKNDVIRIGLRGDGLVKFSSTALLLANSALLIEGLLLVVLPDGAFSYDTLVHLFFLGFAFSMIFAHGPIILPSVLGIPRKPYHSMLYVWLMLLHLSVVLRMVGNTIIDIELRKVAGAVSVMAILGYFVTVAILVYRTRFAR